MAWRGQRVVRLRARRPEPVGDVIKLLDGDVGVFDSTIILQYIEERWPESPLLPDTPAERARDDEQWSRTIVPDDVLLFRYSALTFNGHRIHYDRRYCNDVEGYPGLVVHGPLIATLLLDLLRRNLPDAKVASFSFRALSPIFDVAPFTVKGRQDGREALLWAARNDGGLAMEANATLL